ncbi:MAG TPA: dicarboxylate/amino acid:cation symporter [Fimbriimonadaceae bacterium]|nr:dicarboxylate/amino acid:cation symporter [Fimbriimonadaceae bacterium]
MTQTRRGMPLHVKILIGLVLGFATGWILQSQWGAKDENLKNLADNYAGPIGQIFLNMIFMVVVPLLFSALVLGVSSIGDARKVGRVGGLSLLMTLLLSGIAVIIGLLAVNTVRPGDGISKEQQTELMSRYGNATAAADAVKKAEESKSAADTILDIVTSNPLKAAVDMNILGFMFFALVFGIGLSLVEAEKALPVKQFLEGVFEVALQIIGFAMKIAPYAVFALGFKAAAILGLDALLALGKYAGLVLLALAFHQFVVYSFALKLIAKRNPLEFFRQIRTVMVTAFATSSSNATLPEALRAADKEVGLPKDISSFVLTVGATANQNGTALFEGITCLFLAQMYGVNLDLGGQMTVMLLAILAGVGTAGVPGGSWPYIAIILTKIGVPPEAIGICLGIDRILDMSRTVLNVSGDITIAACVTRLMGDKREAAMEAAEAS